MIHDNKTTEAEQNKVIDHCSGPSTVRSRCGVYRTEEKWVGVVDYTHQDQTCVQGAGHHEGGYHEGT